MNSFELTHNRIEAFSKKNGIRRFVRDFVLGKRGFRDARSGQESSTGEQKNLSSLLMNDGIAEHDLEEINKLQNIGFSIFTHGSGITANKLSSGSDIDFAAIGNLSALPKATRDKLLPDIPESILKDIDYTSISVIAKNGRKISIHLENPNFRLTYPNRPYAIEYRSNGNIKSASQSSYILNGVDREGNLYAFSITCPQIFDKNGVYNFIPQTGTFTLKNNKAISLELKNSPEFEWNKLATIDRDGSLLFDDHKEPNEIMIFGLELNKMTEDVAFESTSERQEDLYVKKPIKNCLRAIESYCGRDAVNLLVLSLQGRAALRTRRDGRQRLTPEFINTFIQKIHEIQERD